MSAETKNKPLIQPLFDEWWRKGGIVVTNDQVRKDIEQGFYCGVLVAMGLIARANTCSRILAEEMVHQMKRECDGKLKTKQIAATKVVASIEGKAL